MKYAQRLAFGSFELVTAEALVLPGSLQEFFRRRGLAPCSVFTARQLSRQRA